MPVSSEARKKVIEASGGYCELFHDVPVPGEHITHFIHQGQGGASEDSERNSSDNLLYCCKDCHDLIDGRMRNNHPIVVEFSRDNRVLEVVDDERRKISHDQIFFHQWPTWRDAVEEYPLLADAIRRRNEAEFDLAKSIAKFRPSKKAPELFRVCPAVKQMQHATFRTFLSLIGMTFSEASELMPIGDWLNDGGMDSVRGLDINAIDALRKAPDEEVARLLGLTATLPKFYDEVDKVRVKKSGKRSHYWQWDEKTGKPTDLGLHHITPDIAEAFLLFKGNLVGRNDE